MAAKKSTRKSTRKSKSRKAAKKTSKTKARKTPAKSTARKTSPASNKAVRLTFSYDGDDVKLLSQQRTEMTVPPSDAMKRYGKYKGFWAELRSESDKRSEERRVRKEWRSR